MRPGIYDSVLSAEYHSDCCDAPSLSSSVARLICQESPRHGWAAHPKLNPNYEPVETNGLDYGSAVHAMLLDGSEAVEWIAAENYRTKDAQTARDAARSEGRIPMLAKDRAPVEAMLKELDLHHGRHFSDGKPEQVIVWFDDEFGVWCRARLDWLRDDYKVISDYKTRTTTANPSAFCASLFREGYDIQASWYCRGVKALSGVEPEFRFVVQETSQPYAVSVVSLGPAALLLADKKCRYALQAWKHGIETGDWPGYDTRVHYADLPAYEEAKWLQREGELV